MSTINPMKLKGLKSQAEAFQNRHPKFFQFFKTAAPANIQVGSIIEVRIKNPEGREVVTNLKITPEDEELMKNIAQSL